MADLYIGGGAFHMLGCQIHIIPTFLDSSSVLGVAACAILVNRIEQWNLVLLGIDATGMKVYGGISVIIRGIERTDFNGGYFAFLGCAGQGIHSVLFYPTIAVVLCLGCRNSPKATEYKE